MRSVLLNDFDLPFDSTILDPESSLTNKWAYKYIKRGVELIICIPGFLILLPLLALIAILVKLTSPGPVFYRWRIMRQSGKPFTSYKFRTMVVNAEQLERELRQAGRNEMDCIYFKLAIDPRVTPIGIFLRKFSLDELPSIWNVLTGELSLVGPRPIRECEYEEMREWHKLRFLAKPGITGLWQVSGKNRINCFDDIVLIDICYVRNWSLSLDFQILLKTVICVFSGSNY